MINISFKEPRVPLVLKKIEITQMKILPKTQRYLKLVSDCASASNDMYCVVWKQNSM